MKRSLLAGVLALALLALSHSSASAQGWGITPGYFSASIGINMAWSGIGLGCTQPPCSPCYGGGPCYGPNGYPPPAMYQAWPGAGFPYGGYGYDGYNGAPPYANVPVYGY